MASLKRDAQRKQERTPAGNAFSELAVQILRLSALLTAAGDKLAAAAGQSSARWQVLAAIEDTPRTVAHIARILGLTRQSVQRVAGVLERKNMVSYESNPEHRRAHLVCLSPKGRSALETIQAEQRPWADTMGLRIGESETRRSVAFLGKVAQLLEMDCD